MYQHPDLAQSIMDEWPQIPWLQISARAVKPKPALGYLHKRLRQRMAAARAGIGKMHRQLFGIPALLPPGMTALSIDQLCALIKTDVSIADPEKIEKMVWRKSLPIMHLAIATQLMLAGKFSNRAELGCDLQDIDFYREAVKLGDMSEEAAVASGPAIACLGDLWKLGNHRLLCANSLEEASWTALMGQDLAALVVTDARAAMRGIIRLRPARRVSPKKAIRWRCTRP